MLDQSYGDFYTFHLITELLTTRTEPHRCIEIENHASPFFIVNMHADMDLGLVRPTTMKMTTSRNIATILHTPRYAASVYSVDL